MTIKKGVIKIEEKSQTEISTYSEPELWNQVAHVLHVWSQGLVIRLGASEIFVVVANKVVVDFAILKETTCSIILYKQRSESACFHHETRLTQMHENT